MSGIIREIKWDTNKKQCFYCKCGLTIGTKTRDHVIPKSRGGNGKYNYVYCCIPCNRSKDDMNLKSWLLKLENDLRFRQKLADSGKNVDKITQTITEMIKILYV